MPVTISGSTGIAGVDGSAGTPAVQGADTNTGVFFPAADTVAVSTGGTERMRIDASGNVGIGTTTPNAASGYTNVTLNNTAGGIYDINVSGTLASRWYANSTGAFLGSNTSVPLIFNTVGTERARIDTSGNLLVGTTDTAQNSGTGVKIRPAGQGANNPDISLVVASNAAGITPILLYSTGAAAYRFYVNAAGTIFATNTTISAISDQRFKENVRDLDIGLDAVMALKPRKFDWKEGKGKDIKDDRGFIAQEFEQVFPDLIDEWKDESPDGEEPYKSVRQDLIPVLVKAIQELKAQNDELKARVEALEAK